MIEDPRALASVQPDWPGEKTEAFFYAQFVCAAYAMGEGPVTKPPPPAPSLPDGFEIVADVYMTDFVFEADKEPTHYGLLAAKGTHFVLAIRGTVGWKEWWADLTSLNLVPCIFKNSPSQFGQVGYGFLQLYNTLDIVSRTEQAPAEREATVAAQENASFATAVKDVIAGHLAKTNRAAEETTVDVAGHSLGSALATLYAMDSHDKHDYYPTRILTTFASPRVGDQTFVGDFTAKFPDAGPPFPSLRFAISSDVVTTVPPTWMGFVHVGQEVTLRLAWSTAWWWAPCSHSLSSYMHVLNDEWPLPSACTGATTQDRCSPPGFREAAVA